MYNIKYATINYQRETYGMLDGQNDIERFFKRFHSLLFRYFREIYVEKKKLKNISYDYIKRGPVRSIVYRV